jgi:hypothetical protein
MNPIPKKLQIVLGFVILVFAARIVATYPVLSDTIDAAWHIGAGLDYLRTGVYDYEPQHPPLGRLAVAALPYWIADLELGPFEDPWAADWISEDIDFYWKTLTLSRLGNLPFGVLLILVTFLWTRDLLGEGAATVAALIASCSPNILAHSGLATLDIATAATFLAACYAIWLWSRTGTWSRCFLAATAASAAFLSKFSVLGFLPLAFVGFMVLGLWRALREGKRVRVLSAKPIAQLAVFVLCICLLCWGAYGFDVGAIAPPGEVYLSGSSAPPQSPERVVASLFGDKEVPAPVFWQGIIDVMKHNRQGHRSYLFGEIYQDGRWYYFPVVLILKTTLPLLILIMVGVMQLRKQGFNPTNPLLVWGLPAAIVLAGSMYTNINIGVRHILPLYPFLAMLAAGSFQAPRQLLRPIRKGGALLALLLCWHVVESAAAHPDYLAYFNQIVRGQEGEYLADSNLDWGQDLARLGRFVEERGIERIFVVYTGPRPVEKFGIPHGFLPADHPECCWVAAGINQLKAVTGAAMVELDGRTPTARVGASAFLYQIPAADDFWKRRSIETGRRIVRE